MSIVFDVVQKIVFQSALELTCSAMVKVFKRCRIVDTKRIENIEFSDVKGKSEKIQFDCDAFDEEEGSESNKELANEDLPRKYQSITAFHLNREDNEADLQHPMSTIDIALRSSGPIYPPHTSSMRLVRNSYFS